MAEILKDGAYVNAVTGMGIAGIDKAEATKAAPYAPADMAELARMKVADGVAAAIVERVPEQALKYPVTIAGDNEGKAFVECVRRGLFAAACEAGEAQRLTGGAVVVAEYGDAARLAEAPSPSARVTGYRVYDASQVDLRADDFDGDSPRVFRVRLVDGTEREVSPARCAVLRGKRLPGAIAGAPVSERFFGTGFLKPSEQAIKDLADAYASIVTMLSENGLSVFTFDSLNQLLQRPAGQGLPDLQQLMSVIKLGMSTQRAVYLGKGDSFEMKGHSFAGVPEAVQKLVNRVSATTDGIPVSILFGQAATGLANTNDADNKEFMGCVETWRSRYLYAPLRQLVEDIARRNLGMRCDDFEWGPVFVMTEAERNDAMAKQADYLTKYIDRGVISVDEVRRAVFVGGHSFSVTVEG